MGMTDDLALAKACAERMGLRYDGGDFTDGSIYADYGVYDPLHDDTQAMALVKRFRLDILDMRGAWSARFSHDDDGEKWSMAEDANLNRAICLCVASIPTPGEER